jgi:hypothetical protein
MCVFIRPNTLLLCTFLFWTFLLYRTDLHVEVQIRILLKHKYRKSCQNCKHRQSHFDFLKNTYGGTFFPVVLLCCVSFWFWRKIFFDLHTHVLLRVQYSCGGVLVFWFWREIVLGVTHILSVQYSCAVVSVFWL